MPNTVSMLKIAVAGFMQRTPSSFVRTVGNESVDLLLVACNNARLYAERLIDFEYSKRDVKVEVSLADGGTLAFATEIEDENTGVGVKKIITPFITTTDGGTQYPIELWGRKAWNEHLKRNWHGTLPTDPQPPTSTISSQVVLVQDGLSIWVYPADASMFTEVDGSFPVYFNVVSWLPTYEDGTEDDFLLDNCFDWMMFYCISQLNFFLKEDERVQLSAAILRDTWDAVIKWNNELIASTSEDSNLE